MQNIFTLIFLVLMSFQGLAQSLTSISPNAANAGQTLNVTITGANTNFTQGSGTTVGFIINQGSSVIINSLNIISNTSILANITVPSNTYTGDYSVYVYNSNFGYLYLTNGFHINGIPKPSLASISPNIGNAGQTLNVTITGTNTNFIQGSGTTLSFGFGQGSSTVNSMTVLSNTSIAANISIPANTISNYYHVYLYNSIDGYLALYYAFQVNGVPPPSIASINPNIGDAGQTLNVTITGANTNFIQGSGTTLSFGFGQGSSTVNSMTVLSNTSIAANISIPANTISDYYNVYLYNSIDGYLTLYDGFQVNGVPPPSLVSISPGIGNAGQTLNVTITGANTNFIQGSGTTLSFGFGQGSSTVNSQTVLSNTSISANISIPANTTPGDYDVFVYNDVDGFLVLDLSFHVNAMSTGVSDFVSYMDVFPNPADGTLFIENYSEGLDSEKEIFIYDIRGTLLLKKTISGSKGAIEISHLARGFYILKMHNSNEVFIKRFMKE